MPRKRKTDRKKAEERALRAWSLNIRHRAGNQCEVCGKETGVQAHHIRSVSYKRSKFHRLNGVSLCWQHHKQFAHGDGPGFLEWLRLAAPDRWEFALDPKNVQSINRSADELLAIAEDLEAENRIYELGPPIRAA